MSQVPLRIIHLLRAPVGGLFRCARDLIQGQIQQGHQVGLICAHTTTVKTQEFLETLRPQLALGLHQMSIARSPGWADRAIIRQISQWLADLSPQIVHGHGAKGGAYARLARHTGIRVYTPHGGSLLERPGIWAGLARRFYLAAEGYLGQRSDLIICESQYCRRILEGDAGVPEAIVRHIPYGLYPHEFYISSPNSDATDLVFIGELRSIKGVHVLLKALAHLQAQGKIYSLTVVGDGPERRQLESLAQRLAIKADFVGAMPAQVGFRLGRLLVIPSLAESLPYIILEALAAQVPTLTTAVGGIAEIYAPYADHLIPANDPLILAQAIEKRLAKLPEQTQMLVELQSWVAKNFQMERMQQQVMAAYQEALAKKNNLLK
ncbi:MAG: glycosyltransferase family 4 protein [Thermostichales cyanobacterium HHBFW_bins_127]